MKGILTMEELKQILDFVRRTNPEITPEKLRNELNGLTETVLGIMTNNVISD